MKVTNCVKIGLYNIKSKKKHSAYLFACILIITTMLVVWSVVAKALSKAHDEIVLGAASECSIYMEDENPAEKIDKEKDVESMSEVIKVTTYGILDVVDILGKTGKWSFTNMKRIQMKVGDDTYQGVNDYTYGFESYSYTDPRKTVRFKVAVCFEETFFDANELREYEFDNEDYYKQGIIYGSSTLEENEILITDYYLDKFGIDKSDYEEMIGKEVSFQSEDGIDIMGKVTIAGIVDSRIYYVNDLFGVPQIIYRGNALKAGEYNCGAYTIKYSASSFDDLVKMYDKLEYKEYYVNEMGYDNAEKYSMIEKCQLILNKIVSVFGILIMLAITTNLFYVLWNDIREKKGYYGILKADGMRNKDIFIINYFEILIMTLIAGIISMAASIGVVIFVKKIMKAYSGIVIALNWYECVIIYCVCVAVISIMIFLCEVPSLCNIGRQTPDQLLRTHAHK